MFPPTSPTPRVLLASTPSADPILRHSLAPLGDVVSAFTHEEAMRHIEAGVDAVVCSLRFDESRMLDLIAEVAGRLPHLPFICCHVLESELPGSVAARRLHRRGPPGRGRGGGPAAPVRAAWASTAPRPQLNACVRAHLHGAGHASIS